MNSSLELDNKNLRYKLQELRKANSNLISENHRLADGIDELSYELKNSEAKVKELIETVSSCQSRTEELSVRLTDAETLNKTSEKDGDRFRQKFEECSQKLVESANLLSQQSVTIELLNREMDNLKLSQKQTEANRDLALDTAERLQHSYEELQIKFKRADAAAKEETDAVCKVKCRLAEELQVRCSQVEVLQAETKKFRTEIATLKNLRLESDQRNSDLRAQIKNYTTKIEKLGQDLETHKKFKLKNGEMKTLLEQQRKKIASMETEIREFRCCQLNNKESHLQSVAQKSNAKSSAGKRFCDKTDAAPVPMKGTNVSASLEVTGKFRAAGFDANTKSLFVNESELLQLKADFCRLVSSLPKLQDKDDILKTVEDNETTDHHHLVNRTGSDLVECYMAAISNVEKRLANFETRNASLIETVAQLNALTAQLEEEVDQQVAERAAVDRELQKRINQVKLLEKQLDEKVQEVATKVSEANRQKEELELSRNECLSVGKQLEEKSKLCVQSSADLDWLKELHAEHCEELEEQILLLEKRCEESRLCLQETEARCHALQRSLSQTIDLSDAIKQDLETCKHMELLIIRLEQEAKEANSKALSAEQELHLLRSDFNTRLELLQATQAELNRKNERVLFLEAHLQSAEEKIHSSEVQVHVKEEELEKLSQDLDPLRELLSESAEKIEHLLQEKSSLQENLAHLEINYGQEVSSLTLMLEDSEAKLQESLAELDDKHRLIEKLQQTIQDLQMEAESLKKIQTQIQKMLKDSEEKLQESLAELDDKHNLIEQLQQTNQDLQMEVESLRNRILNMEMSGEREMEREQEKMKSEMRRMEEELNRLRLSLKEKDGTIDGLQGRLLRAYSELQEKSKIIKDMFAEAELLKADIHTKDLHVSEATRKAEKQNTELVQIKEQLEDVKITVAEDHKELRQKQSDIETMAEKLQERDSDLRKAAAKVTQLEQTLNNNLSILTESQQKLLRAEGALQKNRLDARQREDKVGSLEDQLHDLLAHVKDQCIKIQKDEATIQQLNAEIEKQRTQTSESEKSVGGLRQELQSMRIINEEAEEELCSSREHLRKIQEELSSCLQVLSSTRFEHDRLAKDLAEAVMLLQKKDAELAKILQTLSDVDEWKSGYNDQLEQSKEALQLLKDTYERDMSSMKKIRESSMVAHDKEKRSLQQDLSAALQDQRHYAEEVLKLVQEVNRLQRELDLKSAPTNTCSANVAPSYCQIIPNHEQNVTESLTVNEQIRASNSEELVSKDDLMRNYIDHPDFQTFENGSVQSMDGTSQASSNVFQNHSRSAGDISKTSFTRTQTSLRGRDCSLPLHRSSALSGHLNAFVKPSLVLAQYQRLLSSQPLSKSGSSTPLSSDDCFGKDFFQTMWQLLQNADNNEDKEVEELSAMDMRLMHMQSDEGTEDPSMTNDVGLPGGCSNSQMASTVALRTVHCICGSSKVSQLQSSAHHRSMSANRCSTTHNSVNCIPADVCSTSENVSTCPTNLQRLASVSDCSATIRQRINSSKVIESKPKPPKCLHSKVPNNFQSGSKSNSSEITRLKGVDSSKGSENHNKLLQSLTTSERKDKRVDSSAPISPIFANRHSPDPTTAVSYYGKLLPARNQKCALDRGRSRNPDEDCGLAD